jgi:hypothetical protein
LNFNVNTNKKLFLEIFLEILFCCKLINFNVFLIKNVNFVNEENYKLFFKKNFNKFEIEKEFIFFYLMKNYDFNKNYFLICCSDSFYISLKNNLVYDEEFLTKKKILITLKNNISLYNQKLDLHILK